MLRVIRETSETLPTVGAGATKHLKLYFAIVLVCLVQLDAVSERQ